MPRHPSPRTPCPNGLGLIQGLCRQLPPICPSESGLLQQCAYPEPEGCLKGCYMWGMWMNLRFAGWVFTYVCAENLLGGAELDKRRGLF